MVAGETAGPELQDPPWSDGVPARRGARARTCTVVSMAYGRERSVLALSGLCVVRLWGIGVWLVLVRYDCDVVCCVCFDRRDSAV